MEESQEEKGELDVGVAGTGAAGSGLRSKGAALKNWANWPEWLCPARLQRVILPLGGEDGGGSGGVGTEE